MNLPAGWGRAATLLTALVMPALTGCGTRMPTAVQAPYIDRTNDAEDRRHASDVLQQIEERNRTVEADVEWRRSSYEQFMITPLGEIPEESYASYAKYLDKGSVYIVVHPAYYTFFQTGDISYDDVSFISEKNAVDRLLEEPVYSPKTKLIRAQEKALRDFLEFMSTERKLVVLVLPRGYRKYPGYKYRNSTDEYMRFINEVTNSSPSVLYLYSRRPNRGTLLERDRRTLLKFLVAVRAREIMVGGGYVGRCLEDFYKEMEQYYEDRMYVVPEITAISPADVAIGDASDIVRPDGTVDIDKLSVSIRENLFGNQQVMPKIKNLTSAAGQEDN